MVPVNTMLKSQFITARSVARHMIKRKSGVIIFVTGSNARGHNDGASAIGTAFGAIETFMENFAYEISRHGVRAVCLRTTANLDSRQIQETLEPLAAQLKTTKEEVLAMITNANFKKVGAKTSDTAKLAVLLASDRVRMITGTVVNSTAGAGLD
jgi:NAD(P)-dependent dehydrogenase (short-subunit alcohol dehydrogenase family)